MTTNAGFKADQTIFTTPPGWTHIVVHRVSGGATTVSAGGTSQPIGFGASSSALELRIGNFGPAVPLWFDDVLATVP